MSTQDAHSETPSVFNNENLTVSVSKLPNCQIHFDIHVNPLPVQAAYYKALKNVNKEVIIPGFRKGRAPDAMILEKFAGSIEKEFIDLVLQTSFNEAVHLTNFHPIKDGHMKRPVVQECSKEKGAHFTIEFEVRPFIPSIHLEELKIKKISLSPITEEEQKNAFDILLHKLATYEPIIDRPVEENDFIDISVNLLENPPREVIKNQRTQVNSTGLPSWLLRKVIGLKANESAEGMTEQDSKLTQVDSQFQSLPFQLTVHSIWKGNLPAVDEELAKRLGVKTIEELHAKIKERLEEQSEDDAFKSQIDNILQLLLEKYPLELPQSYIEANKEARFNDYIKQMGDHIEHMPSDELENVRDSIEKSSLIQLQLFFLLRKIASDNHITVDNDDLTKELTRQIGLMSSGRSSIDLNDKEAMREQLHNLAFDRKIKQFLIDSLAVE